MREQAPVIFGDAELRARTAIANAVLMKAANEP
jgi:hypothetical protein